MTAAIQGRGVAGYQPQALDLVKTQHRITGILVAPVTESEPAGPWSYLALEGWAGWSAIEDLVFVRPANLADVEYCRANANPKNGGALLAAVRRHSGPVPEWQNEVLSRAGELWAFAASLPLTRRDTLTGTPIVLEPGVNFFVLAMEDCGAVSRFSCEGHPGGFYVAFDSTYEFARRVSRAGYFNVEIESFGVAFSIRLPHTATAEDREFCLTKAAASWIGSGIWGGEIGRLALKAAAQGAPR